MIGFFIALVMIVFITNIIQDYERSRMIEVSAVMASAMEDRSSQAFDELVEDAWYLGENVKEYINNNDVEAYQLNKMLIDYLKTNKKYSGAFLIVKSDGYTYHPYWYRKDDVYYQDYIDYENTNIFESAMETGNIDVLDPVLFKQGGDTVMLSTIHIPFELKDGSSGVIGINFSYDFYESFMKEISNTALYDSYLISANNIIIGDSKNLYGGLTTEQSDIEKIWLTDLYVDKGMMKSGVEYVMNIPIDIRYTDDSWTFLVKIKSSILHQGNRAIQLIIALPLLLGITVLALFVRFTVKKNLDPINGILAVMDSAEHGTFTQRTKIKSSDEIQVIGDGLNNLLDSLEDHHEKLHKEIEDNEMLNQELEYLIQENDRIYFETIKSLNMAIEAKDPYTAGHCDRVTEYSLAIAEHIGMSDREKTRLIYGATIHDIGKIGISGKILNKTDRLTDEEFNKIKAHPEKGYNILKTIHFLEDSISIVYQHHERYDGNGYPQGLQGEEIDISARIVAIADTYDAMTSDRAYRKALSSEIAIQELIKNKGTQFDPVLVDAFVKSMNKIKSDF